jgi:lipopolysaccharide transport system permease protein
MAKTVIENKRLSISQYLFALWKYRGVGWTFVKRDLKSRYAQTRMGFLWMIFQPLLVLGIFTVLFDQLIQLDTANIPYPVFAFSGMTIWYLFTAIVQGGGKVLQESQDLIRKVHFPRLLLPLSRVIVALLESSFSFIILAALMFAFNLPLSPRILLFPVLLLLLILSALCLVLWISTLSVKYRDMQHMIPQVVNTGIWLTPVFYPITLVPEAYRDWVFYLNPVATLVAFFRSILFDLPFQWNYMLSFIIIFLFLVIGLYRFRKIERKMADFI